eukprot:Gb_29286 [translate_table: standard]
MPPKGQELHKKPETRAERIARWKKEQDQVSKRLPRTIEPMQTYSHQAHDRRKESRHDLENEIQKDASLRNIGTHRNEDRNPTRNPETSDKVIEDTTLLAETKNCQPEARPSRASPNLMYGSKILSNITHKPIEAAKSKALEGNSTGIH